MEKIPVHIISGFLGAGKTTEIIRLLGLKPADESWAIIINEFGKISIDGQTLQSESDRGSVYEISGGCICCTAKYYFRENLENIIATSKFNRIIIEPSGLGGIDHITEMVKQNSGLQLMPAICIVDITMTKLPRLKMLPIYRSQIQKADCILFSKTDLVKKQECRDLQDQFALDFPGKKYLLQGSLADRIPNMEKNHLNDQNISLPGFYLADSGTKVSYNSFTVKISENRVIHPDLLAQLLQQESSIVRAKGYIYTGNEWILFNYTLSGISKEKCDHRENSELVVIYESTMDDNQPVFGSLLEKLVTPT